MAPRSLSPLCSVDNPALIFISSVYRKHLDFNLQVTKFVLTWLPSPLPNPNLSLLPSSPNPSFQKPVLIAVRFMSITRTATPVCMPLSLHVPTTSPVHQSIRSVHSCCL